MNNVRFGGFLPQKSKILIYLADLTHTGQLVASNIHPLGVGLIGAYMLEHLKDEVEIELFKYPQDLNEALGRRRPTILGFANYSWNCNLSYEYARRVKAKYPETVIVFGGPNYGLALEEQVEFWRRYPLMDFYVLKEGEAAMVELFKALKKHGFDANKLKAARELVPSCHYQVDGQFFAGPLMPRFKSLDEIPSPYLMGLMDKFFDKVLIPLTCTTRGCPFSCTFCTEGTTYYNKVTKRHGTTFQDELNYMAKRVHPVKDIVISDANFGMFPEDLDKARIIAETQKKEHWPTYIHVSGGKNSKERLIEVSAITGGALKVAAALQSTDEKVLENVKRKNISLDQLMQVAQEGVRVDADTYAEIILNLPGDTVAAHTKSLRDATNAGVSFLRMYQLIMLLETDMNTPDIRRQYGMKTKYRVMPRCFGHYELFGEKFACAEIEEICVAQDSLSIDDYVECRELDLTIEITHNMNIFRELFGLSQQYGFSWFDFLMRFHKKRREHGPELRELYDTFKEDTLKPLWDSRDELIAFAKKNLDKYLLDELGTNELFKGKAIAFFNRQAPLHTALFKEMALQLKELGHWDETIALYLGELELFSKRRKVDLLDTKAHFEVPMHFNFERVIEAAYAIDPHRYRLPKPAVYDFSHNEEQRNMIDTYVGQYGTTVVGLGRILMRAPVKKLFRSFRIADKTVSAGFEKVYERSLNLYGD